MLFVFLLPALLAGIGYAIWNATERDREMRRIVRAAIRKELNPPMERSARWTVLAK